MVEYTPEVKRNWILLLIFVIMSSLKGQIITQAQRNDVLHRLYQRGAENENVWECGLHYTRGRSIDEWRRRMNKTSEGDAKGDT